MPSRNGSGATITPSSTLKTICEGRRHCVPDRQDHRRCHQQAGRQLEGDVVFFRRLRAHQHCRGARAEDWSRPTRPMSSPMPQPISPCSGIAALKVAAGHVTGCAVGKNVPGIGPGDAGHHAQGYHRGKEGPWASPDAGCQHPLAGSSLKSASVRVKTVSPTS